MAINETSLAYMAGVIDLKGSFIYKNNKQRATQQTTMYVESQHFSVVAELCRLTGISSASNPSFKNKKFARHGCVEHCPEKHIHVELVDMPQVHRWTITGVSLAIVLFNLQPYLRADKPYFNVMVEVFDNVTPDGQGRGAIEKAIQRLKELGWRVPTHVYPKKERNEDSELH